MFLGFLIVVLRFFYRGFAFYLMFLRFLIVFLLFLISFLWAAVRPPGLQS